MELVPTTPTENGATGAQTPETAPKPGVQPGEVETTGGARAPGSTALPLDQPGSTDAAVKTGGQERGPDGKFLGKDGAAPPDPELAKSGKVPPPPPKTGKLGEIEYESPDELAAAADRLRQDAERSKAFERFVKEAAEREKKAKSFEERLKGKDALTVLAELGHDPYQLALERVRQEMENQRRFEGMTEEQIALVKRAEAAEARANQIEHERQAEKQAAEQQKMRAYRDERAKHYIGVINQAFELVKELPRTGEVQVRLVQELKRNLRYGYNIPPDQLARKVLSDLQTEHSSWDTDERFSADEYVKKHPKRAEAIRAAVVKSLTVEQQRTQAPAPKPTTFTQKDVPPPERHELLTPEEHERIVMQRIRAG